jgi:hypothetical protein
LNGCSPASISVPPTLTSIPTNTPLPTKTPVPSNTPMPTETAIPPTVTVPAPDKSLEYLNSVEITYIDNFDKQLSKINWRFGAGLQVANGVLEILGKEWSSISPRHRFNEGDGVIIDFTYTKGALFQAYLSHGFFFDTATYKAFAIYFKKNLVKTNVWAGNNSLGGEHLPGNFALRPDTDYSLLTAIAPNGEFLMVIWKPSDPSETIYYHEKIGKNWSNLEWEFGIAVDGGTILLDNYREIKFDSVK